MYRMLCVIFISLLMFGCSTTYELSAIQSGDCVDRVVKECELLRSKHYQCQVVLGLIKVNGKTLGHAWIRYRKDKNEEWKTFANY